MSAHPPAPDATPVATAAFGQPSAEPVAALVVVGAGLAGWTTVREFGKLNTTAPVVVVTADNGDFYAKPTLSNARAQKRTPAQLVGTPAAKMAETLNVTLLTRSTVEQLDTASRLLTVQSDGTRQTLAYSQLVLATGAQPIRSAIGGDAADLVLSVNSLTDFGVFFERLTASPASQKNSGSSTSEDTDAPAGPKTVLVIGACLIGCEFANDLLHAGHRVHLVDPSPRPLAALLPEAAGLQLQQALQALGAHWHFGTTVEAVNFTGTPTNQQPTNAAAASLRVSLSNKSQIAVDAGLSAIGLRADTALARAAGLVCERGIVVDGHLQTSAPQVYALGDAAQYASAGQRTLPYVMPIMSAAKALAATLNGTPTEVLFPLMPVSIKTPTLPIVVAAAHPWLAGNWEADAAVQPGVWRFVDAQGAQRGFVLTGSNTARRQELSKDALHPSSPGGPVAAP